MAPPRKDKRGGARPGAGRKKGTTSKVLTEKYRKAFLTDDGVTPIECMTIFMRMLWEKPSIEDKRQAVMIAKELAPYMHPKLAALAVQEMDKAGDRLLELLEAIDGKSLGIESGGSPLEIESPLYVPEQGRPARTISPELGAECVDGRAASSEPHSEG